MENVYGIGITNRFSQFLHSDDDDDSIKPTENDKDMKKKGKVAEKENRGKERVSGEVATHPPRAAPAPAPATTQQTGGAGGRKGIRDSNQKNNANDSNAHRVNNRGGDSERGYRSGPRNDRDRFSKPDEHREDRNNRRNKDDTGREFVRDGDGGDRGPRRGGFGGGYRGRGGPRGGGLRKREFDRQSGSDKSGVKPVDKRDGAGSRNWGTYKDDIEDTTAHTGTEETNEEKAEQTGQNAHDEGANTENTSAPPEEEPAKQMTLEEYRALQISQSRSKPVFNVRKAGEGEDQSQWNKMTLKKKEAKPDDEEGEQEEEDDEQKHGGRQKKLIDIEFQFSDSRRGMGNGPGRGRGQGGRGGGGMDRGGRGGGGGFNKGYRPRFENRDARPQRQAAPKVDDERDFPSLGKR